MSKRAENLFDLVPERRHGYEELPDGGIDVLTPRYGSGRFGKLLRRYLNPNPVRIRLDGVGARVWRLCDGRRSVYEIGGVIHSEFGDRVEPLYDRLALFVAQMERRELIGFKR